MSYPQMAAHAADAVANYHVAGDDSRYDKSGQLLVRYVTAEARTGSRYVVVASKLPKLAADREGGAWLVTLLYPFNAAWPMQGPDHGPLTASYVLEKFVPVDRWDTVHGGDLAGITMTIAHALGRDAFGLEYIGVDGA